MSDGDPKSLNPQILLEEIERLKPMAELGRLATTIAHEVRNPLTGISANAELLRDVLTDPMDIESVDIILNEVDRLAHLVSDLMDYSKERIANAEPLDLHQLASSVTELVRADAEACGVELLCSSVGDSGCEAIGDNELSRQALLNIVRNAIQAAQTTVTVQVAPNSVHVIDDGSGVPLELRETLFEAFVTGRTRGLGLGAAVAKRCMSRQLGKVTLAAASEKGSDFAFMWRTDGV